MDSEHPMVLVKVGAGHHGRYHMGAAHQEVWDREHLQVPNEEGESSGVHPQTQAVGNRQMAVVQDHLVMGNCQLGLVGEALMVEGSPSQDTGQILGGIAQVGAHLHQSPRSPLSEAWGLIFE